MAKLFYTLEEACAMLGKSEEEVHAMAQSGQLEEMRDGDQIMFKRQQVDLLVGDGDAAAADLDLDLSGGSNHSGESTEDIPGSSGSG